jgi:hypothetical protein
MAGTNLVYQAHPTEHSAIRIISSWDPITSQHHQPAKARLVICFEHCAWCILFVRPWFHSSQLLERLLGMEPRPHDSIFKGITVLQAVEQEDDDDIQLSFTCSAGVCFQSNIE